MSTATADNYYCGAGTPLEEARALLAWFDARHAGGEHFWRWTGRMLGDRQVLGCMFCSRRRTSALLQKTS